MANRIHAVTLKAFDQYDNAGARVVLSQAGLERMTKKGANTFVRVIGVQLPDGSMQDPVDGEVFAAAEVESLLPAGQLREDWRLVAQAARDAQKSVVKNNRADKAENVRG